MKYTIPKGTVPSRCRGCNKMIFYVRTEPGNWMPVNPDGEPHWATCPKAKEFKRENVKNDSTAASTQLDLFDRD